MPLSLADARLIVSPGALLSVSRAGQLLGWKGADEWIAANVHIRCIDGRQRVLWQDVIDATGHAPEKQNGRRTPNLPVAEGF